MGLTAKVHKALNDQLHRELEAAYMYFGMSAYFEEKSLKGFGKWMMDQYTEEMEHVNRFFNYIVNRGGTINLKPISPHKGSWKTPLSVFKDSLKHEEAVSRHINDLVDLATSQNDHATQSFLLWFVNEQVEEEALFSDIVHRLQLIGDNKAALIMIDKDLGDRSLNGTD